MVLEAVQTEDGSITLRDRETGELYHNRAGAYAEALANYVQPSAIENFAGKDVALLDVCFGLGYNTFVLLESFLKLPNRPLSISIIAVEKDEEILSLIPRVLEDERLSLLRAATSGVSWTFGRHQFLLADGIAVTLELRNSDLRVSIPSLQQVSRFDLIFHDPFSPSKVPELWTVDLFRCYKNLLGRQGRILTYSSAYAVRGGLKEAGLEVWRTTAVGGKSGGTLAAHPDAVVSDDCIYPLSESEESKLSSRSGIPYRDPSFSAPREEILKLRADEQSAF